MAEPVAAHQLTVGDIASVDNGIPGFPMKVAALGSDDVVLMDASGGPHAFPRAGSLFRIRRFASGIPNTPAIAWLDPDRHEHVALQSGHPMNRVWLYNGDTVGESTILAASSGMTIEGLTWATVPRF